MSDLYGWERCDHKGIGQPGCPVCDPNKERVMIRQQRLDNRDLRTELARLREERKQVREALDFATRGRKSVNYAQWPLEWHRADAALELLKEK